MDRKDEPIEREIKKRGSKQTKPNLTKPKPHKEIDTKSSGGAPKTKSINWAIKEANQSKLRFLLKFNKYYIRIFLENPSG